MVPGDDGVFHALTGYWALHEFGAVGQVGVGGVVETSVTIGADKLPS